MDYIELIVSVKGDIEKGRDITIAQLADAGYESFEETDTGLKAYIPLEIFSTENLDKLLILNSIEFNDSSYNYSVIKSENWNRKWEESYNPVSIGSYCYIRALFHPPVKGYKHEIVIHPKMSFGTGHHDTTWLMLDTMKGIDFNNRSVLDLGCGTGILSILAAKEGAASVKAVDIDEWAVENTIENCIINEVNNVEVSHGNINVVKKDAIFDIILANITRNVLLDYIDKLSSMISENGRLLMSGFFSDDINPIESKANIHRLKLEWTNSRNKWAIAIFTTK